MRVKDFDDAHNSDTSVWGIVEAIDEAHVNASKKVLQESRFIALSVDETPSINGM